MTLVTILIAAVILSLTQITVTAGNAAVSALKRQSLADAAALSSVRMRVSALETIAERWKEFGREFGPVLTDRTVFLSAHKWSSIEKAAGELKKALPGYKGRSTAVLKVVAEANKSSKDVLLVEDIAGSDLGVTADNLWVMNESRALKTIEGGWLRRLWTPADPYADPPEKITVNVQGRRSTVQIRWDVPRDESGVVGGGNGGYPRRWDDAVSGNTLEPNRWARFRAVLRG